MVGDKKPKEIWTLGRFADAYNSEIESAIVFAESIPEQQVAMPDFAVFDRLARFAYYVEVTELLNPGRRRDQEYALSPASILNQRSFSQSSLSSAKKNLKRIFTKKLRKRYPDDTRLVVYLNLGVPLSDSYDEDVQITASVLYDSFSSISSPYQRYGFCILLAKLTQP